MARLSVNEEHVNPHRVHSPNLPDLQLVAYSVSSVGVDRIEDDVSRIPRVDLRT